MIGLSPRCDAMPVVQRPTVAMTVHLRWRHPQETPPGPPAPQKHPYQSHPQLLSPTLC